GTPILELAYSELGQIGTDHNVRYLKQPFCLFLCLIPMTDPSGVANRSVTYVDWSEGKWHPRAFRAEDITFEFLKNLIFIKESILFTSGPKVKKSFLPFFVLNLRFYACLFGRKKEQIDVLFVGAEERVKWAMLVEFNEETLLFIRKKVLSKNLAQIDDSFF
ncbi:hypothetical protein Gotri_019934, partial [Gossypium trilobum]|nr:hypothetical protein [Gossypium trilobum]